MGYSNYEWFIKEDLSRYAGDWVVIIDKKIVSSGKDVGKLVKELYPSKRPFVTKINDHLSVLA